MNKMINSLGERMIVLIRVINIDGLHAGSNKFTHELNGMVMALKAMDIEFDFDFDTSVDHYTAVTIMGKRFEV